MYTTISVTCEAKPYITQIQIDSNVDLNLGTSATFRILCLTDSGFQCDVAIVLIDGEDYANWNADVPYIKEVLLTKLGMVGV